MTGARIKGLVISPGDDVAVLLEPVAAGDTIVLSGGHTIEACENAKRYFKIAVVNIKAGDTVQKHGQSIGTATMDIMLGHIVHTHNLVSGRAIV